LATPKKIELEWRVVCGRYELEELLAYDIVKPWLTKNHRHALFLQIKHFGQEFYQGGWGPEILYYDKEDNLTSGQLGKIYATKQRGDQIHHWFIDKMFEQFSKDD
jgi:hypothetical protein